MPTKKYEIRIDAPIERVWQFHVNEHSLSMLAPPDRDVHLLDPIKPISEGSVHHAKFKHMGVSLPFHVRASDVIAPRGFVLTSIRSPFSKWIHRHEFIDDEGGTIIRDTVDYQVKAWLFGTMANTLFVEDQINEIFKYRHFTLRGFVEDHKVLINDEAFDAEKVRSIDLY